MRGAGWMPANQWAHSPNRPDRHSGNPRNRRAVQGFIKSGEARGMLTRMGLLLDSFWRAAAYCMRPRVILLSLLPCC